MIAPGFAAGLRRRMVRAAAAAAVSIAIAAAPEAGEAQPLVAAASDLQFALDEISRGFTGETGGRVQLVFGSSGNLTRQMLDGAGFELFLSADEAFVRRLHDAGLTRDQGVLYGVGRVVVFAPHGSPLVPDERLDGLRALLGRGGRGRFAIANPDHAPYGRAAAAVLRSRGLWDAVQPLLVLGDSVAQAAQFATTGGALGGIVAYSHALTALRDKGRYVLVPESEHPPLRQRMVLMKRAGAIAARFYGYLRSPRAQATLRQHGFSLPDQAP
jgi:molybdate transport system substrate-binding protein